MTTMVWLDPDGYHLWIAHACKGKQQQNMLPYPTWHVDERGYLADGCSIWCNPALGGCGLHIDRVPVTPDARPLPITRRRSKSWAKVRFLTRTLKSWRRKSG